VRYPNATVDDLIDVIEGTRYAHVLLFSVWVSSRCVVFPAHSVYIPTLYVLNKIDAITIEELDLLDRVCGRNLLICFYPFAPLR
jgi:hypothetical protein